MRLKPYLLLSSSLFFPFLLCKEDSPILERDLLQVVSQTNIYVTTGCCRDCCLQEIERRVPSFCRYSKMCPGFFGVGTSIVTWWLMSPTETITYQLSQIRDDFLCKYYSSCFQVTFISVSKPPLSLLIMWANNRNDVSSFRRFSFFIIVILTVSYPLYLYMFFLYHFFFPSSLFAHKLLQVFGTDHVNKN